MSDDVHPRSRLIFLGLVVVQVAHSIEEYLTHLYEVFGPARVIIGGEGWTFSVGRSATELPRNVLSSAARKFQR